MIRKTAKLFRAGDYPDKRFTATGATLDVMVAATRKLAKVPLDLHHADTDETFDLGSVDPQSIRREGEWVVGDLLLHDADLPRFKQRGLSAVIDRATNAIRKLTVTGRPRVVGAEFGEGSAQLPDPAADDAETITLEIGGNLMADEPQTPTPEPEATSDIRVEGIVKRTLAALFHRDPDPEPKAAQAPDLDALRAEFDAKLAASEERHKAELAEAKGQVAEFAADRVKGAVAEAIRAGVPPYIADRLVPLANGADVAQFSEGGQEVTADARQVAADLLSYFSGSLPMSPRMKPVDTRDASFESQWSAKYREIEEAHPDWSPMDVYRATAKVVDRKEV